MNKRLINLVGKKYGRLTVKSFSHMEGKRSYWKCECECGNHKTTAGGNLKSGGTRSCGCIKKGMVSNSGFVDLTGEKFNRLTVISFYGRIKKHKYWNCECECGTLTRVEGGGLKSGNTKSCGCLNKEVTLARCTIHGQYLGGKVTREIRCWQHIKDRCYNPNNNAYKNYGGRGIKICERWLESFDNFLEDLGRCPKGMSIERIDNNGNYEPGNVKWGTVKEQANNKRNNISITYNGETKNLAGWAIRLGISRFVLSNRLKKWNNDVERAFNTPVKTYIRKK